MRLLSPRYQVGDHTTPTVLADQWLPYKFVYATRLLLKKKSWNFKNLQSSKIFLFRNQSCQERQPNREKGLNHNVAGAGLLDKQGTWHALGPVTQLTGAEERIVPPRKPNVKTGPPLSLCFPLAQTSSYATA